MASDSSASFRFTARLQFEIGAGGFWSARRAGAKSGRIVGRIVADG